MAKNENKQSPKVEGDEWEWQWEGERGEGRTGRVRNGGDDGQEA